MTLGRHYASSKARALAASFGTPLWAASRSSIDRCDLTVILPNALGRAWQNVAARAARIAKKQLTERQCKSRLAWTAMLQSDKHPVDVFVACRTEQTRQNASNSIGRDLWSQEQTKFCDSGQKVTTSITKRDKEIFAPLKADQCRCEQRRTPRKGGLHLWTVTFRR